MLAYIASILIGYFLFILGISEVAIVTTECIIKKSMNILQILGICICSTILVTWYFYRTGLFMYASWAIEVLMNGV